MPEQEDPLTPLGCSCTLDSKNWTAGIWYHSTKCPVAKELRGSWCTPGWLAGLIGKVYLDPCSNPSSHVDSEIRCTLEWASDGLSGDFGEFEFGYRGPPPTGPCIAGGFAGWNDSVFCNPPYGPGEVIKWVRHYRHTRFIFLLRWDPSTEWFSELHPHCTHVWFPSDRIDFEPPPRIRSSSNPFPHALYLRDPSEELLGRLRGAGYLFPVDFGVGSGQSAGYGHQPGHRGGSETAGGGGAAAATVDGGQCGCWGQIACADCSARWTLYGWQVPPGD